MRSVLASCDNILFSDSNVSFRKHASVPPPSIIVLVLELINSGLKYHSYGL